MIDDAVVEISVEVVRGALVRLGLPEVVGRARAEGVVAGDGRPVDVPAYPRFLDVGLAQARRLPGLPAVQADVDLADVTLARPRSPAHDLREMLGVTSKLR